VFTHARRLDRVEYFVRDAIGLWLEQPIDSFDVQLRVDSPKGVQALVARARESRAAADAAHVDASIATRTAAERLAQEGLTVRDAGTLLGISHQRVQQLLKDGRTTRSKGARKKARARSKSVRATTTKTRRNSHSR